MYSIPLNKRVIFLASLLAVTGCDNANKTDADSLQQGKELFSKGEFAKAELELKNAIQKNPGAAESYYYMALLNEKSKNYKAMRANLNEVLKIDANYIDARIKLAEVELIFNDLETASKEIETAIKQQAENLAALTVKASILDVQEHPDQALELINTILQKDPNYAKALSLKSLFLLKKQAYSDALATINHALEVDSKNISFHLIKIQVHNSQNNLKAVIDDYDELVKLHPENDEIKYAQSRIYEQIGNKQQAETILRTVLKEKPDNIKPKLMLLEFLYDHDKTNALSQLQNFVNELPATRIIDFAKWALAKNKVDEAKQILNKIIADNDTQEGLKSIATLFLANIEFQQKNSVGALQLADKALELNPNNTDAKVLKSKMLLSKEQYPAAEELLTKVLWERPNSDEARVLLAQLNLQRGNRDEAFANFQEALKINPSNLQALTPVIENTLAGKHFDHAKELLIQASRQQPENLEFLQMLAKVYMLDKQWNEAEKIIATIDKRRNGKLLAQFLQAQLLTEKNECAAAIKTYEEVLRQYPQHDSSLHGIAHCYERLGQRRDLLAFLERFIEQNPEHIAAYLLKAQTWVLDNNSKQSVSLLESMLERTGDLSKIYEDLALLYLKQGNQEQALKTYQQGLQKSPENLGLLLGLAQFYELNGQVPEAITHYEKVLSLDTHSLVARNNLANLLLQQGDEKSISRAVALADVFKKSEEPSFLDTYGLAQLKKGDVIQALSALQQVIVLAPNVPVFHYHLAMAHRQQGNNAAAVAELRQTLELANNKPFPELADAQNLLQQLK